MSTMEARIQIRRVPIDTWSIREKLCLASAVARCGDQNWMSVSRALKPFAEPSRPSDWFSQNNCAAQYGLLLGSINTLNKMPVESIIRRLTAEYEFELKKKVDQREQHVIARAQFLKQRKLEFERAFRSVTKVTEVVTEQKRKASDSLDASITESQESNPALSSLLKTPGHVQNVTSSILHSTIAHRGTASPTIASLLNTTASAPVSPSLQQLVSTVISHETTSAPVARVPDTPVVAPTLAITNSATEEKESHNKHILAEESLLEKEIPVDKPLKDNVEPDSVDIVLVTKQDKPGKAKRDYTRMKKKDKKSNCRKRKLKDNTEEEVLSKSRRGLSLTCHSIPNSSSGTAILDDDRDYRAWKKSMMLIYKRLASNKYAYLFRKPITDEQAPGYHSIVHRPMDLQTIRKNIENGVIRTTQEFHRDVLLMLLNGVMYNKRNGAVYKMTRQMLTESLQEIEILLAVQEQAETPVGRETRTSSRLKRKRQDDFLTKNKKRRNV